MMFASSNRRLSIACSSSHIRTRSYPPMKCKFWILLKLLELPRRSFSDPLGVNRTCWIHFWWSRGLVLTKNWNSPKSTKINHFNWNGWKPFQWQLSPTVVIGLVPTDPIGTDRRGTIQAQNYAICRTGPCVFANVPMDPSVSPSASSLRHTC